MYNKYNYWKNRSDPNNKNGRVQALHHIDWSKSFINKNDKILEYGPGVGRMVKLYENNKEINFYDITPTYKKKLNNNCKDIGLPISQYIIDNKEGIITPFKNEEFDVVTCFQVLLHSPPQEISELMMELSRISKKVIVITSTNWKGVNNHVFKHDYKKIIDKNDLILEEWNDHIFENEIGFIYTKKKEK